MNITSWSAVHIASQVRGRKVTAEEVARAFLSQVRGAWLAVLLSLALGCSPVGARYDGPPGPREKDFSLLHEGVERRYRVHVPSGYDGGTATPVVLYIHGGGGNLNTASLDGLGKASDRFGFILVAPASLRMKIGMRQASRWNGGRWKGGECCGSADDVGFLSKMIEALKKDFSVDDRRVYAAGISNGGLMTNRLACELSGKIAAVATVAPAAIESGCLPARSISVMDIHGTADPYNPYDGSASKSFLDRARIPYKRMSPAEVVGAWRRINGCSGEPETVYQNGKATCVSHRRCREGAEVELCTVEGMGHVWPDGWQYMSASLVGPVSRDITFEQIWEFFQRHPLKQGSSESGSQSP